MSAAGLILAAGESRRMGSPKALLEFRGETFLDRLIGLFAEQCAPVIVVLGARAGDIRAGLRRAGEALIVENPDYRSGQITSMQRGLREIPYDAEGVLFTLVDHPNVEAATIAALAAPPWPPLRVPRYGSRRGHPLFFRRELVAEFLAVAPEGSAREVLARHSGDIEHVDVDDPGILDDVDDPAAYRRLLAGVRA